MTQNNLNIRGRFINGAFWMLGSKLTERVLGLVSTLILARLLLPADFGLVAMAAPVIALVELLGAFGIDAALIQRSNPTQSHYNTAWTINIIFGALITLFLWLLAPLAASFFHEARLEKIIYWLAINSFVRGFYNIGMVKFRKELNMAPEVIWVLSRKITSLVVATIAALLIGSYWALIWGMVTSTLVGVIASFVLSKYRPRLTLKAYKDMIGFSSWFLLLNFLNYLQLRTNDLIVGRLLGPAQLAFYNVSIDIAVPFTGEASSIIARVAFPAFSKIAHDRTRLSDGLGAVLSGLAIFSVPAGFGIFATDKLIVSVLLGEQWLPASEIIGALAISTAALGMLSHISIVYMSLGFPKLSTLASAVNVTALIGLSLLLIPQHGLLAVNYVFPLSAASCAISHYLILRVVLPEFRLTNWLQAFWRPVTASVLMYLVVNTFISAFISDGPFLKIVLLLAAITIGAVTYAVSILALWRLEGMPAGSEKLIVNKIKDIIFNLKKRNAS
ncbi:MAG: lipopolysaccharide biosynthesis protein [Sulfuricella sp.]